MESYMYMLSIVIPMLLFFVVLVIFQLLVKQDEKVSYSFRDLYLQLNNIQGESLYCQITLYPWQRHKYREIERYYQKGKIIFVSGHIYEIIEMRGPYKCENLIFQRMLKFYISEKKTIDTAFIEGNDVYIFHDKTIYFDTTPYLQEIEEAYSFMCKTKLKENEKERVGLLLNDLYEMSSTNTILTQKLMYYVETLSEFSIISNNAEKLKILDVLAEIIKYLKETNIESFEERKHMQKDNVTLNINNQVNIASDEGYVYGVQNNNNNININIEEIDIIVRNIMQNLSEVPPMDAETIADAVEMVREEIKKEESNKKILSNGIKLIAPMISIVNGIPVLAENLGKFVEYISAMIK